MPKKQVNLKMEPEELEAIEEAADRLGIARNDLFINAAKAVCGEVSGSSPQGAIEPTPEVPEPIATQKIEALPALSVNALAARCGTFPEVILNKRREFERKQRMLGRPKKYDYAPFIEWIRTLDPDGFGWNYNPYLFTFERVD
jgi:hypothetical protein